MENIKLKSRRYLLITLVMVLSFAFSSLAEALPLTMQLKLEDITNSVTKIIIDNQAGDSNPTVGQITYSSGVSGNIGVFDTVISTGITKPTLGSQAIPTIDLSTVTVNSTAAGSLRISVSDTDFGPMQGGLTGFTTHIGGTTNGTVNLDAYFDSTNVIFGTGTQIADLGPFTPVSFNGDDVYGGTPASSPFSLNMVVDVTHTAANQITSYDGYVKPVPEPGTLLLLGLGLLGLGATKRRKLEIKA